MIDALVRCLEAAGGRLACGMAVTRVEVASGRAVAVHAGGERVAATRAVVSSLDARRLLLELIDPGAVPSWLAAEAGRIHVGRRNVSELKVDATLAAMPPLPGPCAPCGPATLGPSGAGCGARPCPASRAR